MTEHTPPYRHNKGYDPECAACNPAIFEGEDKSTAVTNAYFSGRSEISSLGAEPEPIRLRRRSPVERAGYLLACFTRGTTSATDYDMLQGAMVIEAILDAAGLIPMPVAYKPSCTSCATLFDPQTVRALAIVAATEHLEHSPGHVVELREVIA